MKHAHSQKRATHAKSEAETIEFGERKVIVTHPDKLLFPEDQISKADLVHYYRDVAHFLLPYLKHRPLTLQRFPDGIGGFSFFEKQIPKGMPEWIASTTQPRADSSGTVTYPVASDAPSLTWFANLAAVSFHVWMSRIDTIEHPDFLLFDLDPFEGCTIRTLARVAVTVRDELDALGLTALVKTTGGKGLHLIVPLRPVYTYRQAQTMNELVANRISSLFPKEVTLERSKSRRASGTVYFDWVQLALGKTLVPPYTVRARKGAPVSMPICWDEVENLTASRSKAPTYEAFEHWNLKTVPGYLVEHGDLWAAPFAHKQKLNLPLERARLRFNTRRTQ